MLTRHLSILVVLLAFLGCSSKPAAKSVPQEKPKDPLVTLDGNVALAFSPDGKWIALGAELIDTSTWKIAAMLDKRISDANPKSKNHWGYTSAAFSPDSTKLAIGDQDGSLRVLEVPSMEMKFEILAHGARLTGIGFANDNETLATTSVDDYIRMWNIRTGKEINRDAGQDAANKGKSIADFVGAVDVFALSPNREMFAAADTMNRIVVCSMRDGSILHDFKGPGSDKVEMDSLAFTPDSSKLLIGVTPKLYVYTIQGQPTGVVIETTADSPLLVKPVNDQGLVAMSYNLSGTKNPVVELFDVAQSKSLGAFHPHTLSGNYWGTSGDGKFIATTGRGGPTAIWSVEEVTKDLKPMKTSTATK
jgi:WD40 repeat protein